VVLVTLAMNALVGMYNNIEFIFLQLCYRDARDEREIEYIVQEDVRLCIQI